MRTSTHSYLCALQVAMNEELVAVELTRPSVNQAPMVKKKKGPMSSFSFYNRGRDRGTVGGAGFRDMGMDLLEWAQGTHAEGCGLPLLAQLRLTTSKTHLHIH